jgi:lipoprotein-anchoring transpeptidase ErfK/SrfK
VSWGAGPPPPRAPPRPLPNGLSLPSSRFWRRAGALSALAVGALAASLPVVAGHTHEPRPGPDAAVAVFEAARAGLAPRWAPEALVVAERALRDGLVEWRRQESRLAPLRDFRHAAEALWRAERSAWDASRLAQERHLEARLGAEDAIEEARAVGHQGDVLAAATALAPAQRTHLLRARLLLAEAESLLASGEPLAASERAQHSRSELGQALGPSLEAAGRYTTSAQVRRWQRWVETTRSWSRTTGRPAIVVFKEKNVLTLVSDGEPVRSYAADIGRNALETKQRRGDAATPEGRYRVVGRKDRGQSRFYRALLLDYPNDEDRRRLAVAVRSGDLPRGTRLGGLIEIHGEGGRGRNWTDGCVALSNADMDDLFPRIPLGTPVTIVGGDGRDGTFSGLLAHIDAGEKRR